MNTRIGKIARLPKPLRDELNQRLENGEEGESLLKWLNKMPACKKMLAEHFDGKPINKQNLSDWKQGGYQDWVRNQEARERVQAMTEQAQDVEGLPEEPSLADRLATVLTLQLMDMTKQLESVTDPLERWKQLKEVLRELHRLRREDHHARQLRLAQEKWSAQVRQEADEAEREAERARKAKLLETFRAHRNLPLTANLIGGGRYGWKWAHWKMCVENDLPMPSWWDPKYPAFEIPPEPGEERRKEANKVKKAKKNQGASASVKASQAQSRRELSPKSKAQRPKSGVAIQDSDAEDEHENEAVGEHPAAVAEGAVENPTNSGLPSAAEMSEHISREMKLEELRNS
jgi:hypothetical protein